jgi:hypothetical protein
VCGGEGGEGESSMRMCCFDCVLMAGIGEFILQKRMSLESFAEGFCSGKSIYNKPWREMHAVIVEDTICTVYRTYEISLAIVNMEARITRVIHRNAVVILHSRYSHRTAESQLVQRVPTASAAWLGRSLFINNRHQSFLLFVLLLFTNKNK